MNRRAFAFYLILSALSLLLVACVTRAAAEAHGVATVTGGDGDVLPDVSTAGLARWWQDGRLACVAAFGIFIALKAIAPRVPWLRRGRYQAWIALGVSSVTCVLPAAATGSLTWGGLMLALCTGGGMALHAGGGERKDEAAGEVESAP